LVLGQERTGNDQARHHVVLGQLEAELFGVMVDDLHILEFQRHEALISTCKRLLRRRLLANSRLGLVRRILELLLSSRRKEVVRAGADRRRSTNVD
jgi:hypothetical protein